YLSNDPFKTPGAWGNLPAMLVLILITVVLVIGIRESAASNTVLVLVKVGVVLFVIVAGAGYVSTANWTDVPKEERRQVEEDLIPAEAKDYVTDVEKLRDRARIQRMRSLKVMATAQFRLDHLPRVREAYEQEGKLDPARIKSLAEREAALRSLVPPSR